MIKITDIKKNSMICVCVSTIKHQSDRFIGHLLHASNKRESHNLV